MSHIHRFPLLQVVCNAKAPLVCIALLEKGGRGRPMTQGINNEIVKDSPKGLSIGNNSKRFVFEADTRLPSPLAKLDLMIAKNFNQ